MEIAENHPATMPFVEAVGKLIQNFGMIEMLSHQYIQAMQKDPMVSELAKRAKLRDRVDIVKKMLARQDGITAEQREELIAPWSALLPHAELRNVVAHSPVAMAVSHSDPPQEVVGMLNLKPKDRTRPAEIVSVSEILGSVHATHGLASRMHAGLKFLNDIAGAP